MMATIFDAIDEAIRSQSVRAVIFIGNGTAFCSGGDVNRMAVKTDIEFDPAEVLVPGSSHEAPSYARDLLVAVHECPVPIIAAINGPAVGFGFELAFAADIRIVARSASFSDVFVRRGAVPDGSGFWLLPRIATWATALDLILSGRRIDADEALRCGIVNRVVDDDILVVTCTELARSIVVRDRSELAQLKRGLFSLPNMLGTIEDVLTQ